MNDPRKRILIGDMDQERVSLMRDILLHEFNLEPEVTTDFDALKDLVREAKNKDASWHLVLVAHGLPSSRFHRNRVLPENIESLNDTIDTRPKLGYIFSLEEPPEMGRLYGLYVAPDGLAGEGRKEIVSTLKRTFGLKEALPAPMVQLKPDPYLEEQVRSLSPERNLEEGKKYLSYLLRNLNLSIGGVARIGKLAQGKSGARVFHIEVTAADGQRKELVLKLNSKQDRWKLDLEVTRHKLTPEKLGVPSYQKHVADLYEAEGQSIVEYANWCAVCYDFLGGKTFGQFIDLEGAVIIQSDKLHEKTNGIDEFEFDSTNGAQVIQVRKRILIIMLNWLCKTWYLNATRGPRQLWKADDRDPRDYPPAPPYQLAGKTKGYILSFLDSPDAAVGNRFFDDWANRLDQVRRFVEAPTSHIAEFLARELPVVLSPAHGDLNAGNILLWLNGQHPFLIDFPCYQEAGHALQDLASLEVAIKFLLLDRQGGSPKEKLRAFDHTHSQMEIWQEMEDHLLSAAEPKDKQWLQAHCFSDNVTFCFELVRMVRERAVQVQEQMPDPDRQPEFMEEYLPALLYYTVRAIGYDSLSIFKRLLAVYSTGEILTRLEQLSAVSVHS